MRALGGYEGSHGKTLGKWLKASDFNNIACEKNGSTY